MVIPFKKYELEKEYTFYSVPTKVMEISVNTTSTYALCK